MGQMDEERRGFVSEEEGENGYWTGNSQCPVMLSTRSWFVICAIYLNIQSSSCLSWVDGGDSETLQCEHFLAHSWLHLTMLVAHPPPHNAGMALGDGYPVRFAQHLVHTSWDAFQPARVTRLHRGGYRGYFQHTCEDKIAVHLATLVTSWWVLIYPFQTPACIWFLLHHPSLCLGTQMSQSFDNALLVTLLQGRCREARKTSHGRHWHLPPWHTFLLSFFLRLPILLQVATYSSTRWWA